ncbi:MAG: hypothetical protein KJP00_07930 [Bacteroidia bacterium]|nr:hypothetical protein [Bacteroidia bacterium]
MKSSILITAFQRLIPFKIKFKNQSRSQRLLAFLVRWYIPNYLSHYTTVVGRSIYFPNAEALEKRHSAYTIAHEMVHLLDQRRLTLPLFLLLYLSPQIFAIGVLLFPWLGYEALYFLLFGLPWPSPGRVYLEGRAYALEIALYERCNEKYNVESILEIFQSSGYYYMSWKRKMVRKQIDRWTKIITEKSDPILNQVVITFESCLS